MKSIYVCTIGACIMLSAVSSCRKAFDYIRSHPDDHISFCRITHIRGWGYFPYQDYQGHWILDTLTFYYNAKGDPTDMLDRSALPHSQDQHWRYDAHGRLIAYYVTLPPPGGTPTGALEYDKFGYPKPDLITDTVFSYGTVDFPPTYKNNPQSARIYAFSLDSRGRIIKTYTIDDPAQTQFVTDYTYNAEGNLTSPDPGITYDHMINPYRTNRVFQVTYKDFSLNNKIAVDPSTVYLGLVPAYNAYGLPTLLPLPSNTVYAPIPFDAMLSAIDIDYACAIPKGAIDY